jgi:hypothetical protein
MTTFTLDDFKTVLQALDRKLERQDALAFHQFKETRVVKLRGGFRPLATGRLVQAIFGVTLALFAGNFWFDHLGTPHLMIYGLVLYAYGVMMMVFAIRELALLGSIDYGAPVLAIQKQLAAIQSRRLRAAVWFTVAGCLIWVPALLVLFYLMGADVWLRHPNVVYWNVASSLLCLTIAYAIIWWSRQPGKERLAKFLRDGSIGKSVTRAQAVLAEIEGFERDSDSAA